LEASLEWKNPANEINLLFGKRNRGFQSRRRKSVDVACIKEEKFAPALPKKLAAR